MTNSIGKTRLTEREEEIIGLLSRGFPGFMLDARIVDVIKQDGRTVATLRFTLNEEASADLERELIEITDKPVEELAAQVADILKSQL